jgi:parvulin-like peptidyl-prolyl isomerase
MSTTCRIALTIGTCAALAVFAAGCGKGKSSSNGNGQNVSSSLGAGVAASVGDRKVTKQQVDRMLQQAQLRAKSTKQAFPTPGTSQYRQLQDRAVLLLVQQDELERKASALGINVEKQVDSGLKQLKKQRFGGSEQRYQKALKQQGFTDAEVRDDLRARLISQAIVKRLTQNLKVTTTEVETYYEQHTPQFSTPQTRVVRHILVKTKSLADKLYRQVKGGADFAKLAKRYSIDPGTKNLGGKLTITRGQFVKPFENAAFALRTGQISKPVHSRYGWHVIEAVKPATPRQVTPLKKVAASIRTTLLNQKKQQAIANWTKQFTSSLKKDTKYAQGYQPLTSSSGG